MGETLQLVSDIVVREMESLRIESRPTDPVKISLHSHRLRVRNGGKLQLYAIALVDSVGGSAVVSTGGEVTAQQCTFARCATSMSFMARFSESLVIGGDGIKHPRKGAFCAAFGGAFMLALSAASLTCVGCTFEDNAASGGGMASFGGAIVALGSSLTVNGCIFQGNVAEGNPRTKTYAAYGGVIALVSSRLDMVGSRLVANTARGPAEYVAGGTIAGVTSAQVFVSASSFAKNVASGGRNSNSGGAIRVQDGSPLEMTGVEFVENAALASAELGEEQAVGGAVGFTYTSTAVASRGPACFGQRLA
jgi:hypothetical protein